MAGNDHVIDIFTSEDMENISRYIFQYLTVYYIINAGSFTLCVVNRKFLFLDIKRNIFSWSGVMRLPRSMKCTHGIQCCVKSTTK